MVKNLRDVVVQIKIHSIWQRLAPKKSVILSKGWAVGVWVFALRCVGRKVETYIY